MANKRTAANGQEQRRTTNLLTGNQEVGSIIHMADTSTTETKARGGQLKAKPVTFYPPSAAFRDKIEAVAKMKGRTGSNFICHMIDEYMKSDPDSLAFDVTQQSAAA